MEEFRVAKEHFASIVRLLSSARLDDNPAKWEACGELEISDQEGAKKAIQLCLTGPSPDSEIAFKCQGESEYYRAGRASLLEKAVRIANGDSRK